LRQKGIELILQFARRRPAGRQFVQQDFKDPGLHDWVFSSSERQPRLTHRARVDSLVGRFRIGCHEKALARIRPATNGRSLGLLLAMSASAFTT
jgi:hypothetical protein